MSNFFIGTHPVNSVFIDEDGVMLKVVEWVNCDKCYYFGKNCVTKKLCGSCAIKYRNDHKSVIFVKVKGGENV